MNIAKTAPPPSRIAFATRLLEICSDKGLPARGRQTLLARIFKVSQQAARKWLDAESFPSTETIIEIADWADVNVNWLLQGVGPKSGTRVDAKVLVLDEAVHSLPPELGADLLDNIRTKLERIGKLDAREPTGRYHVMLKAYEEEIFRKRMPPCSRKEP